MSNIEKIFATALGLSRIGFADKFKFIISHADFNALMRDHHCSDYAILHDKSTWKIYGVSFDVCAVEKPIIVSKLKHKDGSPPGFPIAVLFHGEWAFNSRRGIPFNLAVTLLEMADKPMFDGWIKYDLVEPIGDECSKSVSIEGLWQFGLLTRSPVQFNAYNHRNVYTLSYEGMYIALSSIFAEAIKSTEKKNVAEKNN